MGFQSGGVDVCVVVGRGVGRGVNVEEGRERYQNQITSHATSPGQTEIS